MNHAGRMRNLSTGDKYRREPLRSRSARRLSSHRYNNLSGMHLEVRSKRNNEMRLLTVSALLISIGLAGAYGMASLVQANKNRQPTEISTRVRPYDPESAARDREYERLLGLGYRALKDDPQKAEKYLRRALPLSIVPDDALYGLAQALERQGKTAEALSAYRSLTAPNTSWDSTLKREPQVLLHYSLAAAQTNSWPEVVTAYTAAATNLNKGGQQAGLPALPTNFSPQMRRPADLAAMAHVGLGMAQAKRGKNDAALAEFAQAAKLRPNSPVAQFYHGYGLKAVGRPAEAKSAFAHAAASGRGAVKAAAEKELR